MDLQSLEIFISIARMGSINKTAHAHFLAQSTVTHRLKQLEKELEMTLFTRTTSGVTLTEEGRAFLPVASSMMEQYQQFIQQNHQIRPLRIVAGKAFVSTQLPRLLGGYRQVDPSFTCYLRSTLFEESVHSLLAGTADLAFLGNELYHPHIKTTYLPEDPILLVCSPHHPWASNYPGWAEWDKQSLIAFGNPTAPYRQRVDRYLAENGVFPTIIMELDSFSAVKQMVLQNLGIALLPSRFVQQEKLQRKLVTIDISHGTFTRPTLLAYPAEKESDLRLTSFINWVIEHYDH
ncbi:LysR family transcriptional regulator [Brevibacillus laterosporus]|uniref:LysR family transcriptional regulator n=1 Tax=Brevibacillus laterosporus TaxID=1465 RepID=UPI000B9A5FEE|nr:LysR family transcriptional regulator [Brevibacillus laterosporus]